MGNGRSLAAKATCENCYFERNGLCAVSGNGACASFRPAREGGLRPPSQLQLVFRHERRLQVAWAFPAPSEQVARHAC